MDPAATGDEAASADNGSPASRVGIGLSGGGHRATAFGVGVLSAVVGSGLHRGTVSISSVSGGSIVNAAVATAGDFRGVASVGQLAGWLAPTLRVVAIDGLFLPGTPTRGYVRVTLTALVASAASLLAFVIALTSVGRGHPVWPYAAAGTVVGLLGGWLVARLITGRTGLALAVGAVIGGVVAGTAAVCVRGLDGLAGAAIVATIALLAAGCAVWAIRALAQRGPAVAKALAGQFATAAAPDPLLRDIAPGVDHVFCTTDIESAQPLFFAPRFIYGYRHGLASTAGYDLTVGQVVQASAAVPPGFPPVVLDVPRFEHVGADGTTRVTPPGQVRLSDGGVYDNLGDEWEGSFAERVAHYPALADIQDAAELLVISDASPRFGWQPFTASGSIASELLGLLRAIDLLWAGTTTRRRHDLYEQFRPGSREPDRCPGVLVMIDSSPVDVCRAAMGLGDTGVAERAAAAIVHLEAVRSDDAWRTMSSTCAAVATTLGPLTVPVTLDLIELGYQSTMTALYVFLGAGELHPFPRDEFARQLG